jgi:hypothetical protein
MHHAARCLYLRGRAVSGEAFNSTCIGDADGLVSDEMRVGVLSMPARSEGEDGFADNAI